MKFTCVPFIAGMSKSQSDVQAIGHDENESLFELESQFFQDLLGRLEDPVFVKNNKHQWLFANQAFKELIGCDDLIGKTDADLLPADQVGKFYEGDNQVIRTQTSLTQEEEIGEGCYALVKKIPIRLPDQSIGLFGIIFDISEYRKVQLEVEKLRLAKVQSHTDSLTGLSNRRHLEEYFTRLLEENISGPNSVGLLHIDLDNFKEINDTLGHLQGDAVLVHIASILRSCAGDEFIARIGGDEFIVVSSKIQLELTNIAQQIISEVAKSVQVENETHSLSVSIGIASDVNGNLTLNQMLKYADLALYRAKQNGRGRYERFNSYIQHEANERKKLRDDFRIALSENQFIPFYQPQFNTETLEITGVEALARWNHPQRGILLPFEFIELAESERRLMDLDRAILRQAIQDACELNDIGYSIRRLSINLSEQSLATNDLVSVVKGMEPLQVQLCFELVESILLDDADCVAMDTVNSLREMGVLLDIDDFGSGRTSLLGMLEVRPDKLKIDKRLVIPMIESGEHLAMVESILQIADTLETEVIAEGVESEQHRQLLQKMGCSCIQGFGFAKPMPLHELKQFMQYQLAA